MRNSLRLTPVFFCALLFALIAGSVAASAQSTTPATASDCRQRYDVAAYVWPSYHPDDRAKLFWPDGIGEWQTVIAAQREHISDRGRVPVWGYVNEADPYVNEMEIDAAADHGVNVFIFDWYWFDRMPFLEGQLDNGFLKARNNGRMKFYVMWANHDADARWSRPMADDFFAGRNNSLVWKGGVDRETFEQAADRLITRYFKQPNYYTIDGRPVLMIFDLSKLVEGLGGVEQTEQAITWLRKRVKEQGLPGVELQLAARSLEDKFTVNGKQYSTVETMKKLGFDSATHYQFVHLTRVGPYAEMVNNTTKQWQEFAKHLGSMPYYPQVSAGWDPSPRGTVRLEREATTGPNPADFRRSLADAKAFVDAHPKAAPLITINSWNEWTETSYLEPDQLNGYAYLDAVKDVFACKNK